MREEPTYKFAEHFCLGCGARWRVPYDRHPPHLKKFKCAECGTYMILGTTEEDIDRIMEHVLVNAGGERSIKELFRRAVP